MVSLENRTFFTERIKESPKLNAFYHFLIGQELTFFSIIDLSDADEQFYKMLSAIQSGSKTEFEKIYSKKSKSNPSKDSFLPFVNDDFLIFTLIIGIDKFQIDKAWIKNVVSIRSRNATTITLENILNKNYLSTDNQAEVILMYLHLTNETLISNNFLSSTYRSITANPLLLESRNEFQILCALRAYDLIIELKEAPSGSEFMLLRQFNRNFLVRVKILSWIMQLSVFAGLVYAVLKLPNYEPEVIHLIERYNYAFTILGALGITFLGNLIPFARNKSKELVMWLFGYPKELMALF